MGKIEKMSYDNTFETPEELTTLVVYMRKGLLDGSLFRGEQAKTSVTDIVIRCPELDQKAFDILITKIKSITKKTTYIIIDSDKDYKNFISDYKYNYGHGHFPDNIRVRTLPTKREVSNNKKEKKKSLN